MSEWLLPAYNKQSDLLSPFGPALPIPHTPDQIADMAKAAGLSIEEVERAVTEEMSWPLFRNGDSPWNYQVQVRVVESDDHSASPDIVWLSIKRIDKAHVHDWRHLQEIKNMVVGPEYEAIELYPAEERVVDTANQYHLFVFHDPGFRLPWGFKSGLKSYEDGVGNSRQRAR